MVGQQEQQDVRGFLPARSLVPIFSRTRASKSCRTALGAPVDPLESRTSPAEPDAVRAP
ncbi:hypothetical protein ACFQ3Z_42415 [Streptomyces nogalater]